MIETRRNTPLPIFIVINALLLVYVVRITILIVNRETPGLDRYVLLQVGAATGMFLLVFLQRQVPLGVALHDTQITAGICLYGFGILSSAWSVMPAMSLAFALQIFMFLWILYYLMGYHDNFHAAEKYLIRLLVVLLLFGLLRKPVVYDISPSVQYFLSYHELNAGGISAALFSYCLAERLAGPARLDPRRARMLTLVALFALVALLVSTSSGSNVSVLVALCALAIVRRHRLLALLLVTTALALLAFPEIVEQARAVVFPGKTDTRILNIGSRMMLWQDMWGLFLQKPIWGWGFAAGERLGGVYASDSHNAFLGILGGLGLIGGSFLLLFLLGTLWRMYRLRHQIGYTGLFCASVCMVANSNTFGFLSGKTFVLTIAFFALVACGYWYQYRPPFAGERDRGLMMGV